MKLYFCHLKLMALLAGGMLTIAATGYAQESGAVMNSDASNRVYNPHNKGPIRQQDRPAVRESRCVWVNKLDGTRIRVCGAAQRKNLLKH